ncbi:MAG: glycosyltransferase [Yoonia sp.]|uniref:glycosyltransferase n=1 Tax=Yoonia sp. TaxID=2212373 RepID=UPI003EF40735
MVKVLFYNWVDDRDVQRRGGGVTVYQAAVVAALGQGTWATPTCLTSGLSYDLRQGAPRWEQMRRTKGQTPRYEIVNSGTQAPSHNSFYDPAQVSHAATRDVFFDFIEKTGPYDVIHFNNLEGLPAEVLTLKERWPDTRVIFSLHNYYPVCPQVNLWFQERELCEDFDKGRKCAVCLVDPVQHRAQRLSGAVSYSASKVGISAESTLFKRGVKPAVRTAGRGLRGAKRLAQVVRKPVGTVQETGSNASHFATRRAAMIDLINTHCDRVLCVSDAVQRLAVQYGISSELAVTSYIGSKAAQLWQDTKPAVSSQAEILRLAYLGYMRRDKGFFFLLDTLEDLPDTLAQRIHMVIAAPKGDSTAMDRIAALRHRLAGLTYHDGYTHDQLDGILSGVTAGVVPVQWHDNLPQVAIEMHARHIPLITSDLGGARELSNCPDMTFVAQDTAAFIDILQRLGSGAFDAGAYWASAMPPIDLAKHLDALKQHYLGA